MAINKLDILVEQPSSLPHLLDTVGWSPEFSRLAFSRKDFREELTSRPWCIPQAYASNIEAGCLEAGYRIVWSPSEATIERFEEVG